MIKITMKVAVLVFLSGCTFNNYHSKNISSDIYSSSNSDSTSQVSGGVKKDSPSQGKESETKPGETKFKLKSGCDPYVPLPVPVPIRLDVDELKKAETDKDANAIILKNMIALHKQIISHAEKQRKHYYDYKKRCVVKDGN